MPAFALATIPFWSAAATAGGAVAAGAMASHAASSAADKQTQAANYAADKQAQSNADTLAFERQQAENTYRQAEADRKANYDQWAARQSRMNSIGAALGYGAGTTIPAYVAMTDPQYTTGATPVPSTMPTPTTVNPQQAAALKARQMSIASGLGY